MSGRLYTSIYKLKNIQSLEDIRNWKNFQFKEPVKHSEKMEEEFNKLPDNEKFYIYSWEEIREIQSIPTANKGKEIQFIESSIRIEYATKRIFDANHKFLPKNERINKDTISVIFFELDKEIYILIQESRLKQIVRVIDLIGEKNIVKSDWKLSSDFFNWLVYLYSEYNGKISESFTISAISGFTGNVFDNDNIVSSKSMETIKLIATRAFISTGGILREVSVILEDSDNCSICFKINNECSTVIAINNSVRYVSVNALKKEEYLLLYVYTYLIPLLRNLFIKNQQNFVTKKKQFAKKIGIQVVKEVMEENSIEKSEL